ncbi:MAG: 16S rRNA (cytosine(967)-C(5))-methyltransferase RsmB [Oscillospiraceae bacterium]|nr:16S rRNA (cytosine(967)-C(5))-methyltransferase RsmB [Oscillospiraceae bacterium]
MNIRKTVLDLLLRMNAGGYSPILLNNALIKQPQHKAAVTAIFYGVIERRLTLDYVIARYVKRTPTATVQAIFRIAFYELVFMESEEYAVVNETVRLASANERGFVNAVLRSYLREPVDLTDASLSVKYSCPEWLVTKWQAEYGDEATLSILESSLGKPPIFERIAPNGESYIQDESSYRACVDLEPQGGETILDLCAAPGGKSFTIATLMGNEGRVIACDKSGKLQLVTKGAKRLGLSIIETQVSDATVFDARLPQADRVVCDVPCSGLGVIRRKPEIKYKSESRFADLPQIQREILQSGSIYVKSGGVLMYSTCTLSRAENDDVAEAFLAQNPEFELMSKQTFIPTKDGGNANDSRSGDGFFVAYFKRT